MLSIFYLTTTSTTKIYTLSLHDALPIFHRPGHLREDLLLQELRVLVGHGVVLEAAVRPGLGGLVLLVREHGGQVDRKSTRLNSSHVRISYAVFCLKKKKKKKKLLIRIIL